MEKKYENNKGFEQIYSFITLIYYGKTEVLRKKLWYYRHKYGTMVKTNILYRKLWNFNLLWKQKPWHNEKNGTTVGHSICLLVLIIRN